jgi:hypothetical protein
VLQHAGKLCLALERKLSPFYRLDMYSQVLLSSTLICHSNLHPCLEIEIDCMYTVNPGNIPLDRLEAIHTIVEQMVITMAVVSAAQFTERLAIIKQLLEIWSQGEDVDLKCNEQSETSTMPGVLDRYAIVVRADEQSSHAMLSTSCSNEFCLD